jgi:phosphatidylglycerophosphate synthase
VQHHGRVRQPKFHGIPIPVTLAGYALSNYSPGFLWLASLGFAINWFGDSLDGTLARYRRIERPMYGYFVDHTMDAVSQFLIIIGMGLSPYITYHFASMALIAYLMLSILVYLRTYIVGEFRISYGGLGPTETRVVAIVLNTFMYFFGLQTFMVGAYQISVYDLAVLAIALVLFGFFFNTAAREVRRLAALGE